jgi:hypothetical protein
MDDWRDVVGFEGYYQVSRFGHVRSVDRIVTVERGGTIFQRKYKGRAMTYSRDSYGHLCCSLYKGGKRTTYRIHRIVLLAWIGPCPEGCEVCHGPNGKTDNSVDNLRWDTRSANACDMFRDGNGNSRPVRRSDGREYFSLAEAARDTDCNDSNIRRVCNGKRKSAGNYGWAYLD